MSAPMPLEVGGDDLDEVKAAIDEWEKRAAWAEAEYDAVLTVLAALEQRLLELEGEAAAAETRELRRDYWQMAI